MEHEYQKGKVISLMINCSICGKETTKKNYKDGIYVCEACNDLNENEVINVLFDFLETALKINNNDEDISNLLEYLDDLRNRFDDKL